MVIRKAMKAATLRHIARAKMKVIRLAINPATRQDISPARNRRHPDGYTLQNPTYQEMKTFLAQDPTNTNTYVEDKYVCVDFAAAVNNNAEAKGIRCAVVDIFYPDGYGHTIVAFDTTDRGLIYIEPQFDQEVKLVVGRSYSQLNNFTAAPRDDTIKRYLVVW